MADPTIKLLQSLESSILEMSGLLRDSYKPSYSQIAARVPSQPLDPSHKVSIHPHPNSVQARIDDLRRRSIKVRLIPMRWLQSIQKQIVRG
jgi:hypothetical protein